MGYIDAQGEKLAAGLDDRTTYDIKETLNLTLPVTDPAWPKHPPILRNDCVDYYNRSRSESDSWSGGWACYRIVRGAGESTVGLSHDGTAIRYKTNSAQLYIRRYLPVLLPTLGSGIRGSFDRNLDCDRERS